jgi:hypothetical protein
MNLKGKTFNIVFIIKFIIIKIILEYNKKEEETTREKIPPILRRLHPKLTAKDFDLLKDKSSFQGKITYVCFDCFLQLTEVIPVIFFNSFMNNY